MSQLTHDVVFPAVMRDKLRSVRWRQAGIVATRAVAISVAVLLSMMIAAMLLDWCITIFDIRVRILLTGVSLSLSVAALLLTGIRPVIAAFGWTRAAGNVDSRIPQLEERWRTVAGFAESGHQLGSATARAMLAQVTSEAVAMSMLVKPKNVVQSVPLRRSGMAVGLASIALAGFMAINWQQTTVLMKRFWSPTLNISATQLECVTGDVVVPRSQSIGIVTRMNGLLRESAKMSMTSGSDSSILEPLELKPVDGMPGLFSVDMDVDESFRYRIQAGDGRTAWHTVTAIDFPALSEIRMTITPPEYVDEPATEKTLIPGRLRAIQGSQLELAMKPEQELKSLNLVLTLPAETEDSAGAAEPTPSESETDNAKTIQKTLTLTRADDGWYHFETQLVEDFTLSPILLSPHGLTNENPRVCRIEVVEDKAPVARIVSPNEEMAVNPDEKLEIRFEAHDDHGIATAELVIYDSESMDGKEPKILAVQEIPLGDQALQKHVMGKTELDLKKLGLEEGRSISYAVRVTDNRMLEMDSEGISNNEVNNDADQEPTAAGKDGQSEKDSPSKSAVVARTESSDPEQPLAATGTREPAAEAIERMIEDGRQRDTEKAASTTDPESESQNLKSQISDQNADAESPNLKSEISNSNADPESESQNLKSEISNSNEDPESEIPNLKSQISNQNADPESPNLESEVSKSDSAASETEDSQPKAGGSQSPSQEPPSTIAMRAQQSDAGQQQETDRRKLKISGRLDALAKRNEQQKTAVNPVREKVVQIDRMLEVIETQLNSLYKHQVEDDLRGDGFKDLDVRLGDVESFIAELNLETQDSAFEFVGLQLVDIGGTHVTPARDAVFVAIRKPDSGADVHAEEALHHVVSARELLQALLRRYDNVAQEQELAKKLDEAIRMYTVYVEGTQQLLREAQQNFDPLKLQREMAVVEVDQAYLDRLAEVTRMRRDMMSELAKILGDDPRLRARYLDLIKRRRASLRSQLAELAARQDQAAQEVLGWISVSDNQRDNYWLQVSDLRLDLPKDLAKEAQQFADRIEKQMPLVLDPSQGTAALIIQLAQQTALDVRRCDFEVRELRKAGGETADVSGLSSSASDLVFRIGELAAALDLLNFEGTEQEGVADYVQLRLLETRAVADQADTWAEAAGAIVRKQYFGLAALDQQQITIATELLRNEMLGIEADLAGQFDDENPMPQELINLTQELLRAMEGITFNQSSATFALASNQIEPGAAQQELALKGFEEAAKILDQLRRLTIEVLDKEEVQDPNIADLVDPTLDEFLAQLEREPDIEAQLGIPNRPRNIRVLQDSMQWAQNGGELLGTSGEAAMARMAQQIKQPLKATGSGEPREKPVETREMTDEDKKQLAESKDMQQMLKDQMQQTMQQLNDRASDPSQSEQHRRQMQEMAQRMAKALEEMKDGQNPEQLWRQMVQTDQAKAALEALAKGETLPDDQWNKLMSTLDDGLGQVGGRTPPEDYRKAIEQYQERIRKLTGGAGEE